MKSVYRGESIMVLWSGQMTKMAEVAFTLPNGKRLVHIPPKLGLDVGSLVYWVFHPLDPWLGRMDAYLYTFKESGLTSHWDKKRLSVILQDIPITRKKKNH